MSDIKGVYENQEDFKKFRSEDIQEFPYLISHSFPHDNRTGHYIIEMRDEA